MSVRQTAQALLLAVLAACGGYGGGDDYGPTGPSSDNPPTGDSPSDPEGNPPPPPADPY